VLGSDIVGESRKIRAQIGNTGGNWLLKMGESTRNSNWLEIVTFSCRSRRKRVGVRRDSREANIFTMTTRQFSLACVGECPLLVLCLAAAVADWAGNGMFSQQISSCLLCEVCVGPFGRATAPPLAVGLSVCTVTIAGGGK